MEDWNGELSSTVSDILREIKRTDELVQTIIAENRRNTEMPIAVFREHSAHVRQHLEQQEFRITRLENNQSNA